MEFVSPRSSSTVSDASSSDAEAKDFPLSDKLKGIILKSFLTARPELAGKATLKTVTITATFIEDNDSTVILRLFKTATGSEIKKSAITIDLYSLKHLPG